MHVLLELTDHHALCFQQPQLEQSIQIANAVNAISITLVISIFHKINQIDPLDL